jgi:Amt family ammonium transporter
LLIKHRFKVDDSLDVFAVHGVGGMLGSILLAGFALPALGGVGLADGMSFLSQLKIQAMAVGITSLWSGVATWVIVQTLRMTTGLRVTREEEYDGLDLSVHGERAYDFN